MTVVALGWLGRFFGSKVTQYLILAAVAGFLAFRLYGWAEDNGREAVVVEVQSATVEELQRQRNAARVALESAERRAERAAVDAARLQGQINDLIQAARAAPDADNVCIGSDIADRLRALE